MLVVRRGGTRREGLVACGSSAGMLLSLSGSSGRPHAIRVVATTRYTARQVAALLRQVGVSVAAPETFVVTVSCFALRGGASHRGG